MVVEFITIIQEIKIAIKIFYAVNTCHAQCRDIVPKSVALSKLLPQPSRFCLCRYCCVCQSKIFIIYFFCKVWYVTSNSWYDFGGDQAHMRIHEFLKGILSMRDVGQLHEFCWLKKSSTNSCEMFWRGGMSHWRPTIRFRCWSGSRSGFRNFNGILLLPVLRDRENCASFEGISLGGGLRFAGLRVSLVSDIYTAR